MFWISAQVAGASARTRNEILAMRGRGSRARENPSCGGFSLPVHAGTLIVIHAPGENACC
jgi:hypothetical protein